MLISRKLRIFVDYSSNMVKEKDRNTCSASENIDKMYFESARQNKEMDGAKGKTLMYGGASLRIDGNVSPRRERAEAKVIGLFLPNWRNGKSKHSVRRRDSIRNLSDHPRDIITEKSEVLVALPERRYTRLRFSNVIAAASIGYHRKRSSSTMNMVSMTNY